MTLSLCGERILLDGIGFSAIGRLKLLRLLQQRAAQLEVELRFDRRLRSLDELAQDADLLIGADGLNSLVRRSSEARFAPHLEQFANHFAWFGTTREFATLTQSFIRSGDAVLNAHHYRYAPGISTFIVECDPPSFDALGFADMNERESAKTCAQLFSDTLQGESLLTNQSRWRRFPRLWCRNWYADKRVILGDAAHTAHFSIGSGTRLALEDAIALVRALREADRLDVALYEFQRQRQPVAEKIVTASNTSALWYDDFRRHMELSPIEFAFAYLSRSGRMDLERLRQVSPGFVARYERYRRGK